MPTEPDTRKRLAGLIEQRRRELRLTYDQVAQRGRISLKALYGARTGSHGLRADTKAGIEDGLDWERGSVDRIEAGGDPVPVTRARPAPVTAVAEVPPAAARVLSAHGAQAEAAVAREAVEIERARGAWRTAWAVGHPGARLGDIPAPPGAALFGQGSEGSRPVGRLRPGHG